MKNIFITFFFLVFVAGGSFSKVFAHHLDPNSECPTTGSGSAYAIEGMVVVNGTTPMSGMRVRATLLKEPRIAGRVRHACLSSTSPEGAFYIELPKAGKYSLKAFDLTGTYVFKGQKIEVAGIESGHRLNGIAP